MQCDGRRIEGSGAKESDRPRLGSPLSRGLLQCTLGFARL